MICNKLVIQSKLPFLLTSLEDARSCISEGSPPSATDRESIEAGLEWCRRISSLWIDIWLFDLVIARSDWWPSMMYDVVPELWCGNEGSEKEHSFTWFASCILILALGSRVRRKNMCKVFRALDGARLNWRSGAQLLSVNGCWRCLFLTLLASCPVQFFEIERIDRQNCETPTQSKSFVPRDRSYLQMFIPPPIDSTRYWQQHASWWMIRCVMQKILTWRQQKCHMGLSMTIQIYPD